MTETAAQFTDPDGPHAEMRNVINEMYGCAEFASGPMAVHLRRWAEVTERYTGLPDFPGVAR